MTIKELEKICREACLEGKGDLKVAIINRSNITMAYMPLEPSRVEVGVSRTITDEYLEFLIIQS